MGTQYWKGWLFNSCLWKQKKGKRKNKPFIIGLQICGCEYSHHGQSQTTNMMPACMWVAPRFESALAHHCVRQFIQNCFIHCIQNCMISTWIWHTFWIYILWLISHGLYFPSVQFIDYTSNVSSLQLWNFRFHFKFYLEIVMNLEPTFALWGSTLGILSFNSSLHLCNDFNLLSVRFFS